MIMWQGENIVSIARKRAILADLQKLLGGEPVDSHMDTEHTGLQATAPLQTDEGETMQQTGEQREEDTAPMQQDSGMYL